MTSRWLDKRALAEHLSCSVRSIETAVADGMPHAVIFGRVKFKVHEVEAWLEHSGRLQRRGEPTDTLLDEESARRRCTAAGP
jgi:hypothetical protein